MKRLMVSLALMAALAGCRSGEQKLVQDLKPQPAPVVVSGPFSDQELAGFTALDPIDAHAHAYISDPEFYAMLKKLNMRIVDILVISDESPDFSNLAAKQQEGWKFVKGSQGHAVLCTTFDPYKVGEKEFSADANRGLDRDFSQGAIAVKIWKNVGMEIQDAKGNYILPDNPIFAPIYQNIAAHHKTLIAHLADPSSSWAPLDPASPDYSYYTHHDKWYMYDKKNPASKEQILKARDHVLEQNPDLTVVGAHLGSMEADFNQLGQHLDKYPNFAVDMAARMPYVMLNPRSEMIAFLTKYQDKLLYATDNEFGGKDNGADSAKSWEETYARDYRFLATSDWVDYNGRKVQGLALPAGVLKKIYHDNAVKWLPGVEPSR
jgi:hypothetical protein